MSPVRPSSSAVSGLRSTASRLSWSVRSQVWNADQHNVGNALALRVGGCNAASGMVRLHKLVLSWDVLSYEEKGVAVVDLCGCHNENSLRERLAVRQAIFIRPLTQTCWLCPTP